MTVSLDLQAIAEAIATQLTTPETGVHGYWFSVDTPSMPAVFVLPGEGFTTYYTTHGTNGYSTILFNLRVLVPMPGAPEPATQKMYSLLGVGTEDSLFDALWADATLGGLVSQAAILGAAPPRIESIGTEAQPVQVLATNVPVQVLVRKG